MSNEANTRINPSLKGVRIMAQDARPTLTMTPVNEGRSTISMTQALNTLERARNPGALTPVPQQQVSQTPAVTPAQPTQPPSNTSNK
jgi:hypothetical protein